MIRPLSALLILTLTAPVLADGRPLTVDDLLAVQTVSDPQVSPDGSKVVYVVAEIDREAGKTNSSLWMVPIAGGEPKRLTTTPGTNTHPRWSPDGSQIAFVSNRSGSAQIWLLPIDGGEPRQLTKLPIDVSGPIWSPQGDTLAFVAEVYPGKSPEETAKQNEEKAEDKATGKIFDQLMIRHWQTWDEGKRSHLFVADAETGEAKDLTPDWPKNVPPAPFGGSDDYAFSADGQSLAFTSEPLEDHPWSTNTDIWLVSVDGGEPENLTADNPAADAHPAFSPDGRWLAFVRQEQAGFEADQWVLTLLALGSRSTYELTADLDRPVSSFTWASEGNRLFAVIDDDGSTVIVDIPFGVLQTGVGFIAMPSEVRRVVTGQANSGVQVTPDGETLVFTRSAAHAPAEVFQAPTDTGDPTPLTEHNADLLAELELPEGESFTYTGADGDEVQSWLVRPPGFDESKQYPVAFLIHGGPQGSWHDSWHARWNLALFAAPGYVVVAPNPRGSTGFGQGFTDQISQDWSGRVYDDLMLGLDDALERFSFLDGDRVAALGGSFGGYMVNWIAGQTDRFQALISHAGVFDLHSMYFTTEELWFVEWEFGGTPWDNPEAYQKHSPSNFVQNFRTPTLVIHGALDFRVPDAQGLGMFTALQRKGVPSRYLYFPDEGHWIASPANRVVWWNEVHGWLEKYLK